MIPDTSTVVDSFTYSLFKSTVLEYSEPIISTEFCNFVFQLNANRNVINSVPLIDHLYKLIRNPSQAANRAACSYSSCITKYSSDGSTVAVYFTLNHTHTNTQKSKQFIAFNEQTLQFTTNDSIRQQSPNMLKLYKIARSYFTRQPANKQRTTCLKYINRVINYEPNSK